MLQKTWTRLLYVALLSLTTACGKLSQGFSSSYREEARDLTMLNTWNEQSLWHIRSLYGKPILFAQLPDGGCFSDYRETHPPAPSAYGFSSRH